jgi:hypothetical protein
MTGAPAAASVQDLVVDAAAAVKWYVPEVHQAEAATWCSPRPSAAGW